MEKFRLSVHGGIMFAMSPKDEMSINQSLVFDTVLNSFVGYDISFVSL